MSLNSFLRAVQRLRIKLCVLAIFLYVLSILGIVDFDIVCNGGKININLL